MITSAKNSTWLDDIIISNFEIIGLPAPSVIRFKIFTIDERFILGKIGTLHEADQIKVQHQLKKLINFK